MLGWLLERLLVCKKGCMSWWEGVHQKEWLVGQGDVVSYEQSLLVLTFWMVDFFQSRQRRGLLCLKQRFIKLPASTDAKLHGLHQGTFELVTPVLHLNFLSCKIVLRYPKKFCGRISLLDMTWPNSEDCSSSNLPHKTSKGKGVLF